MFLTDKKVVILEDDPGCVFTYQDILDIRYKTQYFASFSDFGVYLQKISASGESNLLPDLIIADLKLEDGHLLNFLFNTNLKMILDIPLLIVSSTEDIDTIRFCLDKGAKDYLIKPFKKNELIVKIEYHMNGQRSGERNVHESEHFGDLTKKEQNIIDLFFRSREKTVDREDLNRQIWGKINVHPKTLDVHLYNLRKKIAPMGLSIVSTRPGSWTLQEFKQ